VPFNFIGTWKSAQKEGKELYLRTPSERKGNTSENINEKTGLLSKDKRPSDQEKPLELKNSFEFGRLGSVREIKLQQLGDKGNRTKDRENPTSGPKNGVGYQDVTNSKDSQAFDEHSKQLLTHGATLKGEDADDESSLPQDDQNIEEVLPSQQRQRNSQTELLINENQRERSLFPLGSNTINKFAQKFNNLLPEDKIPLRSIKIQDMVRENAWCGKPWYEYAAMLAGAVVGGFKSGAMPLLYNGGLLYVDFTYGTTLMDDAKGITLSTYLILSTIPDAFSSNMNLWQKGATYVFEESLEKTRMFLTGLATFFPSLLEPLNLVATELYIMNLLGLTGTDNEYVREIKIYSIPLLMDSWASNYNFLWQYTDNALDWFESKAASQLFCFIRSPEAILRENFRNTLDKLSQYVFKMAEEHDYITDLYDTLVDFEANLKKELKDVVEEDNMDAAHTFFLLRHLLSLGDKIQEAQEQIKACHALVKDWGIWAFIWGTLTTSSYMRFLNLEYGVESTLDFIVPANTSIAYTSGIVASSLGFIPLTLLEYMGLNYFFKDYLWHEKSHAHGSNLFPHFRVSEKVLSGLTGLIYVGPYALLTLQMYNSWYNGQWWPWLFAVPYLFSNFTAQTMSYDDSYNRKVGSGMVGIHNKYIRKRVFGKDPRQDYKKDYILQTIENMRARTRTLPDSVLHMLDQTLHVEEMEEVEIGDEI
jgi:hypothetical protein